MSYRFALGLGSNLGDRLAVLRSAVDRFGRLGTIHAVSSLYETAPVGGPEQGPFFNAVVVLDTDLAPPALLESTQAIESAAGRVRNERWGPRTLDVDILTGVGAGGRPVAHSDGGLSLPHPRAVDRHFVLAPLAEVWPDAPLGDTTAAVARARVLDQTVHAVGSDWLTDPPSWMSPALVAAQGVGLVGFAVVTLATGHMPRADLAGVAGVVLAAGGAGLGLSAVRNLGPALSPMPEPRPGTRLVETGPYRWVRHPIYLSLSVAMAGVALAARSWPAAAVGAAVTGLLAGKARFEERRLLLSVPGYADYRRRVRGGISPR